MADTEDKEKAEKVAAARKRYEQLKKQKAKKGGKKEKAGKGDTEETAAKAAAVEEDSKAEETGAADAENDDTENAEDGPAANGDGEKAEGDDAEVDAETTSAGLDAKSMKVAGSDVQEIYRKQTARIEALEKENKRLAKELEGRSKALERSEGTVEDLQEGKEDDAELRAKAQRAEESDKEVERLKAEVESLERQNTQLQSSQNRRRSSVASPPASQPVEALQTQLSSKTAALESLELELSTLRHSLLTAETRASDLESRVQAAESTSEAADKRFTELKSSLETSSTDDASEPGQADTQDAQKRLALLTADLSTARHTATAATTRAETLSKKCDTLTKLHRDAEIRHQTQTRARLAELDTVRKEALSLRKRLASTSNENARLRSSSVTSASSPPQSRHATRKSVDGDGGGVEDLEEEELANLRARVRSLESEVFDLRRGVWRDRRREMQGGPLDEDALMTPGAGSTFDDVDLDTPTSARAPMSGGVGNAFAIQNILSTFRGGNANETGRSFPGGAPAPPGAARASLDFMDEDAFDEGAFAAAQEAEAKARLERVKEVKRGLGAWKGWKVDMVDVRGGAMAGVFDV